ncbi:hypothetical protein IDM40_13500 [Nocardiopsis sp. HNM0947]|uniref:Uncharacterized protein n=1 Tax=Nocardiopsis coralli TaxID=2772213 RepID=A0ABR9P7C0_9ACTN|nr:hypothetical protein [Nocardiopsis coralli]MBE2999717.1 hypothetical protein [Nocardiopsis coralli]
MPRLSHTFDITPVDRAVLGETVAALHGVARACRFDGRGWLALPDEHTRSGLRAEAEELGLLDGDQTRRLHEEQDEAAERSARAWAEGDTETAEEEAVAASQLALQLRNGRHLAPRSHYLLAELSPAGVPTEPAAEDKGWSGTGLTVTSWDEHGTSSVAYAMPDTSGGETAVTWGGVEHDASAEHLNATTEVQIPGRGAWLRYARADLSFDTGAWYEAAGGGSAGGPPALVVAEHRLVRVRAWLQPSPGADGRWSVEAVLDVRGRGVFRPMAALMFWAVLRSTRREDHAKAKRGELTLGEQLAEDAVRYDRIARNAPRIPGFLHRVRDALAGARDAPSEAP